MQFVRALLLFGMATLSGCGSNDDTAPKTDAEDLTDCAAQMVEPPLWKTARTDATAIRVVTTGDARSELHTEIQTFLQQISPELASQSRDRIAALIVEEAEVEVWVAPDTCARWSFAEAAKEAIAHEAVFLRLNQQFARDIQRFRDLGVDPGKSEEQRSSYLTTALLLLDSIDTRYIAQTLAVNYERELIQSKLDELGKSSGEDFSAVLNRGLKSSSVAAAERTRLSLEKFSSIDPTLKKDGLKRMDRRIAQLRLQDVRAEINDIHQQGMAGDYAQAEAAAAALERIADDGSQRDYADARADELRRRARTLRTQEIDSAVAEADAAGADSAVVEALGARLNAFASAYGDAPELAGWRARLKVLREAVAERAAFAAHDSCSSMAELNTYTEFQFGDTDFGFSNRKTGTLLIETTNSKVTVTNMMNIPIRLLGVSQQLVSQDGTVISTGTTSDAAQIAAAESFTANVELKFDNQNPAAAECMTPLARRTYACQIDVVTNVQLEGRYACAQTTISHTEGVRFESQHQPDNYTIKLRRSN